MVVSVSDCVCLLAFISQTMRVCLNHKLKALWSISDLIKNGFPDELLPQFMHLYRFSTADIQSMILEKDEKQVVAESPLVLSGLVPAYD